MTRALTLGEVAELPAVTDLVTAGRALGIGRTTAYELARSGHFPCPVIRAGTAWRVPVAGLLEVLGLPAWQAAPAGAAPHLTGHGERRVDARPADSARPAPPAQGGGRPRPGRAARAAPATSSRRNR